MYISQSVTRYISIFQNVDPLYGTLVSLRRVVGNVTIEVGTIVGSHIWSDPPRASARVRPVYPKKDTYAAPCLLHGVKPHFSFHFLPTVCRCVFTAKCSQLLLEKRTEQKKEQEKHCTYLSNLVF